MIYLIRKVTEQDDNETLYWNNEIGWTSKEDAWGFSPEETQIFDLPTFGEWEPQPKQEVTLDDLRHRLHDRPMWAHALTVIDMIEERMNDDHYYSGVVNLWLTDSHYSTVWLRDEIMEPLRQYPILVEIGKQFNPTTEWDNTWMPLDTAIYCIRIGRKIGE